MGSEDEECGHLTAASLASFWSPAEGGTTAPTGRLEPSTRMNRTIGSWWHRPADASDTRHNRDGDCNGMGMERIYVRCSRPPLCCERQQSIVVFHWDDQTREGRSAELVGYVHASDWQFTDGCSES